MAGRAEAVGCHPKSVDDLGENGLYILTGSSSKEVDTPHTGTLRISKLKMYPMSLYESEESNGTISLSELFDHPEHFDGCISKLSIDGLILPFAAAVGRTVCLTKPTAQNWKLPKTYTDKPTLLTSAT